MRAAPPECRFFSELSRIRRLRDTKRWHVTLTVLVAILLWLSLPFGVRISRRFVVVSGPSVQNPLYLAVLGQTSAEKFETIVASNSNWINQVDRMVITNDPPSLLSLCAELD